MLTGSKTTSTYQPDIDGLRSIAVMSVVLFHAGFTSFSGGYVGVDVFFVISGFLITRILVQEFDTTAKIDFGRFYLRRARRLLPALFFTLICTSGLAIWLLSPQELERYGQSVLHAVLSVSNVFFLSESGYFDTTASLKPLLHTWSLGVEEQFYFLWPFLLGYFATKKSGALTFVILIGALSFCLCLAFVSRYPDMTFFLTPFRVFEFSLGAILVWVPTKKPINRLLMEPVLGCGLACIAYSVFFYDDATVFPGVNALLPCLGTAMCIYAGQSKYLGVLLRNRMSVSLGLISYSLYLVHWPIITFYNNHFNIGDLLFLESMLLVGVSITAAIFMYFVIEKPFRKVKPANTGFVLACALLALGISYVGASMWGNNGWSWRSWAASGTISTHEVAKGKGQRFIVREKICQKKGWGNCDELLEGHINALIMGDSHAVDALNAFEAVYPLHDFSMSQLDGCPPYHDIETMLPPKHPDRIECIDLNKTRHDPDNLRRFDYIVINVHPGWYGLDHLEEYLSFLDSIGIEKVIVMGDYLTLSSEMYELLNQHGYNDSVIRAHLNKSPVVEFQFREMVERYGYFFLSKRSTFCDGESCELYDSEGIPFTYDKHHLSYEFSIRIAVHSKVDLDSFLANPLEYSENQKKEPEQLKPSAWGPRSSINGTIANKQPDGSMGIWIKLPGLSASEKLMVYFDGSKISKSYIQKDLITVAIPSNQISDAGKYPVTIEFVESGEIINVGYFTVNPSE
jgi:peptidoglycan/LPS O-acetylase OafA/YrhL